MIINCYIRYISIHSLCVSALWPKSLQVRIKNFKRGVSLCLITTVHFMHIVSFSLNMGNSKYQFRVSSKRAPEAALKKCNDIKPLKLLAHLMLSFGIWLRQALKDLTRYEYFVTITKAPFLARSRTRLTAASIKDWSIVVSDTMFFVRKPETIFQRVRIYK